MDIEDQNQEAPASMDETLSKVFDDIQQRDTVDEASIDGEVTKPETETQDQVDGEPKKGTGARDATGKFKSKSKAAVEAPKPEEGEKDQADPGSDPATAQEQAPASQPPASWSAAAKEAWKNAPPAIRQEVLKRENDIQAQLRKSAETTKRFEALDSIIEPSRQVLSAEYGSVENGIKSLFELSNYANVNPYEFAAWFIARRGLDATKLSERINAVIGQKQGPSPMQGSQPQSAALESRLQKLEGSISERQTAEVVNTVQSFRNEKNADGSPANPYFDEVRDDIADLIEIAEKAGKTITLKQAYDKACRANDLVYGRMQEEKSAVDEKKRKEQQEKDAKQARQASTLAQATRSNAGASPSKPKTLDETLSETFDKIQNRAA